MKFSFFTPLADLLRKHRVAERLMAAVPWPFPVSRPDRTNPRLTELFLAFAARDDLTVRHQAYDNQMIVSCGLGILTYRASSYAGRVAGEGSFTKLDGHKETWDDELPSRWAVRQLVRAVNRKRFMLPPERDQDFVTAEAVRSAAKVRRIAP